MELSSFSLANSVGRPSSYQDEARRGRCVLFLPPSLANSARAAQWSGGDETATNDDLRLTDLAKSDYDYIAIFVDL
jgi:hypothetical protein|tara:strand:- start:153 stop:380 length:228 start_codon:yes stop_codon:yes gene_type:complete